MEPSGPNNSFMPSRFSFLSRGHVALFALLACLLGHGPAPAGATEYPLYEIGNTWNGVLLSTNATTVGSSLSVEACVQHTIHIVAVGGSTNTATVVCARALDTANWMPFSTNTLAGGAMAEVTATGKWSYFRATLTATNSLLSVTATYLGGR
jgi:hypothetical protein